jgi:hypothetical protein
MTRRPLPSGFTSFPEGLPIARLRPGRRYLHTNIGCRSPRSLCRVCTDDLSSHPNLPSRTQEDLDLRERESQVSPLLYSMSGTRFKRKLGPRSRRVKWSSMRQYPDRRLHAPIEAYASQIALESLGEFLVAEETIVFDEPGKGPGEDAVLLLFENGNGIEPPDHDGADAAP